MEKKANLTDEETSNLTDEEKLLNFCKICLAQNDQNKKFKKTTRADLLRLLRPKIPEKIVKGYLKNNAGWKEDSLLRYFDDILFDLFLTGLKIHSDRLDPSDDPIIANRFEFRYLDHMLKIHTNAIKELKKENERLLDGEGSISLEEHKEAMDDLYKDLKTSDEKSKQLKNEIKTLNEKLEFQRKHFEDTLKNERKIHESIVDNLQKTIDKMACDK